MSTVTEFEKWAQLEKLFEKILEKKKKDKERISKFPHGESEQK